MKQRVFIDMDGVLCEYRTDADLADMETAGYFRNLRPRKKMLDAVRTLVKSGCADVFILSSVLPQTESESVREKNEWLGHSDFSTTANIYAHLDYSSKLSSAQAMENGIVLPGAGGFESKWQTNDEKS